MKRRDFIIKSRTVFTAAFFSQYIVLGKNFGLGNNSYQLFNDKKRQAPSEFTKPIMKAIAYGMYAPNPHNTQAWKFKIVSDTEMLFYVDEKRILPATDPTTRQIHIGTGCFLATLISGMSKENYETNVLFFPEGTYNKSEVGEKPVAKISLVKSETNTLDVVLNDFSAYITSRLTNRMAYSIDIISHEDFNKITALASPLICDISIVNSEKELPALINILYEGMVTECYTHDAYDESRILIRYNDEEKAIKRDGLTIDATVGSGMKKKIIEKALKNGDHDTWHKKKNIERYLKGYRKTLDSSRGVVLFKTKTNNLIDWVKTGIDYAHFHLAATKFDFYVHPLSQVLQEYPEMSTLYNDFNKMMKVSEPEKIQMAVRIGKGEKPYYSYRRNVKDLIVK